jgi:hypothetical protein
MALNAQRIADISQAMYGAVLQANDDYDTLDAAKAAKNEATGKLSSKREEVLGAVAELSSQGAWSHVEVLAAAKAASQMYQGNDKAKKSHVETLVNHCKLAAHPLVRDRFVELHTLVVETLELESLDPEGPKPVMKLFKRRYHAIVGVLRLVAENVNPITDAEDLIDYAKANDPDHDPKRAHKKLQSLIADLLSVNDAFQVQAISDAVKYLTPIDEEDLTTARARRIGARKAPATVAAPAAAPKPNEPKAPATAHPFTKQAQAKPQPTTNSEIATALNDAMDELTGEVELAEAA